MSGHAVITWATGVIVFLGALAIMSRLLTFPQTPAVVKSGVDGMTNLFNGAFFS